MRFCDYLLRADEKYILLNPAAAWKWLQRQPYGLFAPADSWTERAKKNWRHNLLALRAIARRLERKPPRILSRNQLEKCREMDEVAFRYVHLMRPYPQFRPGAPDVLFQGTCIGLQLLTTHQADPHDLALGLGVHGVALGGGYWQNDWDVFWQHVFYSLLSECGVAVCGTCGKELEPFTKTGRRRRQRQCGNCAWKKWRAKQSQARMRQKWLTDKGYTPSKEHPL
jgi:hypothetical protein